MAVLMAAVLIWGNGEMVATLSGSRFVLRAFVKGDEWEGSTPNCIKRLKTNAGSSPASPHKYALGRHRKTQLILWMHLKYA